MIELAKRGRGTANTLRAFAAELREIPGEWRTYPFRAKDKASAGRTVTQIRKGTISFPPGDFEARRNDDDPTIILVRCIAHP